MQELLARLKALDPNASLALRIIACFDELVRGGVNIQGLLGAAASLSGCVAGFAGHQSERTLRVAPDGQTLKGSAAAPREGSLEANGMTVWLERRIRPANPSTPNEQLQAPSCPRKPSCTPCLKRFPIRAPVSPARAGSTARNSRLN
jgi:hypothetical protein